MHNLIILLARTTNTLSLSFKNEKDALSASAVLNNAVSSGNEHIICLEDDYGRRVSIPIDIITAHITVDLESDMEAQTEQASIKARAEQKLRVKMANDPMTKLVGGMQ